MCILIHSTFCVLNFVLPALRQNFATVDRATQKVKLACFFCVHKHDLYARLLISSLSQRRPPVTTNRESQDTKLLVMSPHRARLQNISYHI